MQSEVHERVDNRVFVPHWRPYFSPGSILLLYAACTSAVLADSRYHCERTPPVIFLSPWCGVSVPSPHPLRLSFLVVSAAQVKDARLEALEADNYTEEQASPVCSSFWKIDNVAHMGRQLKQPLRRADKYGTASIDYEFRRGALCIKAPNGMVCSFVCNHLELQHDAAMKLQTQTVVTTVLQQGIGVDTCYLMGFFSNLPPSRSPFTFS